MTYKSFLLIFLFIFGSCDNSISDSGSEVDEGEYDKDEYYVKYEVNSSTIYSGGKLDVIINTESNKTTTIVINQRQLWEVIIGPVQKDFEASLNVSAVGETQDRLTLHTAIYVSKNNSPFALKAIDGSDTPRDNVQIRYTIDY